MTFDFVTDLGSGRMKADRIMILERSFDRIYEVVLSAGSCAWDDVRSVLIYVVGLWIWIFTAVASQKREYLP